RNQNGQDVLNYVLNDHLGSVQVLANEQGGKLEEYSYDAWGLRRDPNTWRPDNSPQQNLTDRGFTGHEHLDAFALVNMNGRVYDPVIGYFTSPDPIGTTSRTQSFNLYAYCANNPLSHIDPSGYWSISFTWQDVVNTTADVAVAVMALTITITTAGTGTPAFLAGAYGGFVGGSFGTLLHGGSYNDALVAGFKGAVFGALAAGGAEAIGALPVFSNQAADGLRLVQELARAGAHGSFQGGMSMFQGGKFIHGFAAGAMGSISGAYTQGSSVDLQLIVAAGVGGTAAVIGGGKFANGAVTGAYVMMFNHLMHEWHPTRTGPANDAAEKTTTTGNETLVLEYQDHNGNEYYWVSPHDPRNSPTTSYWVEPPPDETSNLQLVEEFHYSVKDGVTEDGKPGLIKGSFQDWQTARQLNIRVTHTTIGVGSWTFEPTLFFSQPIAVLYRQYIQWNKENPIPSPEWYKPKQ
ncbi:MAG: RHS repeat-associated core domain-containing protein, partial [Bacteroidales bacterium]|nr:RHS repeat-associated core domain-containing protein [Bacteroidales bacterium]